LPSLILSHIQVGIITNQIIEGFVSVKRLKEFLGGDELQPDARQVTLNPKLSTGDAVCLLGMFLKGM
jgi:hypothetical protein